MKPTQRASSPPAPAYTSPPVSPTITQVSSRRSTPSPSDARHDVPQSSTLHHASPPRSQPSESQPKDGDVRPRAASERPQDQDASRARIAFPHGRLARLLHDKSQYMDSSMPPSAIPPSTTSLSELAHLIRLERYQEQRRSNSRVRLHRWLVLASLSARLLHCGEASYRTLVDQFRSNDLPCVRNFAELYNAFHEVRNSCEALRRYAVLEQDLEPKAKSAKIETATSFATFMHEIPSKTRSELLTFVSEIRTNPEFLATRIASLSQQELAALTSFRSIIGSKESIFASGKGSGNAKKSPSLSSSPTPVGRLLSFQRHDPLSALIFTIFANSSGPDSAEDLRRTDAWATTCARLISEDNSSGEALVRGVLDTFAGMREWPAKANLELFLMNALQEGQFLLEKAEGQSTTSDLLAESVVNKVLEYATEEFFDRSVRRLLELIDDEPSAGGMPEGVIEIGSAILKRMGPSKRLRSRAETYILHRWFFSWYLREAIIWPESHGIMVGYHIPFQARDKILREIALRVQKQVLGSINNVHQAVTVMPEVKTRLESLLNRLRHPKLNGRPVLQPAKAIASPRETVEVQPFLVVCPSDIITLVNSLFPEQRPASAQADKPSLRGGLLSSASSISSMPFRTGSVSTPGDGSSVLSMSASSITSDSISREPLLESPEKSNDECDGKRETEERSAIAPISPTEDYGRRLRMACSEMQRILGPEASSGTCHPCAERWAVLYVSPDGKSLRTRMRKDSEDDESSEEDSDESDGEDEGPMQRLDLEFDYHTLKESIVKLLQEYELPKLLAPESESKAFSNRTTAQRQQRSLRQVRRTEVSLSGDEAAAKSKLVAKSALSNQALTQRTPAISKRQLTAQHLRSHSEGEAEDSQRTKQSDLEVMLETAFHQCQSRQEFVSALQWYKTLEQLGKLSPHSLTRDGYAPLLNYFARGPRDSLAKSCSAIEEFEAWFAWLKQSQDRYDANIDDMVLSFRNLRDKMWYKNAVITSAGYEEAKNVAFALKMMGQPSKAPDGKGTNQQKPRQLPKTNNFLLKTETQLLDIMAANPDIAGPNKLADEQSEMTSKWLSQYAVENFCKGEERIHRFCLEIDKCVNKLVGDRVLEAPVLWSSELFRRDKEILDSGRQKGDLFLTGVGTLSIASDEEYETHTYSGSKSLDFVQRPSQSNLRPISTSCSQQSFGSSIDSSGSRGLNILDMQDCFGAASPALAIDETETFWSPFPAQAHSPVGTGSIRPTTSSSSRGTVMLKNSSVVNQDKRKFILDLKQTLTGLLLSDLGSTVFGNGSETDSWFSGDLGEECIQRKEADERWKQKLARKKSMRSLKCAKEQPRNKGADAGKGTAAGNVTSAPELNSAGEHSTSSTDARSSGLSAAKKAGLLDFPYNVAFRRLLRKFATHPNPFAKLHTLFELELLIIASLSSRAGRNHGRQSTLPTVPQSPTLGSVPELSSREASVQTQQPQNIEDAIANVAERRSLNAHHLPGNSGSPSNFRSGIRSPTGPPSTDNIIEVLQSLFRDSEIRPKTLFRDLQYIAAFVPATMLDKTARGKAFWDAGLAALGLKQDVCRYMIEIADDIVAEHTERRTTTEEQQQQQQQKQQQKQLETTAATTTTTAQSPDAVNANQAQNIAATEQPVSRWTMADAAQMLIITAKEGDAVAERELAIFYLTHPDLLPRTVSPLSKPKEIFKGELLNRDRRKENPARSDPMTMCVAQHWMEQSRKGGDELATKYLRARDDIERIP